METKLARISQMSKENPGMVFTSIGHLISKELLTECHKEMDGENAVGIDGITKADYESNLEENLDRLIGKLRKKAYKSQAARKVEIPKDNGKMRQLSIYCYEDKLIQEALKRILEAVFEPHFYDEMMGFRPNRGCHKALSKLNGMLMYKTNYVLDADIKGFFDHMDHEWIIHFIESKIKDPNIIRLVRRMIKAGVMDNYHIDPTEEGSGQGSVCSPIISNIYMHYVLVWWFKERVQPYLKGYSGLVVYADDFVVCFQYKSEAEEFYKRLKLRMEHFGLKLEEEKSRLIEFGRFANGNDGKPATFDFLGFTHYCSVGRNGKFKVKRKTSRKKFRKKLKEINKRISNMRALPTKEIIRKLNEILTEYFHYYGVQDNYYKNKEFRYKVLDILFYWLNRRSQKRSYTRAGFYYMIDHAHPMVQPKTYVYI